MEEMGGKSFAWEVIAMFPFKCGLRFRFTVLCGTTGMLLVTMVTAFPAAAKTTEQPRAFVAGQGSEQQPSARKDQTEALAEYQQALKDNPRSSLAYYRIAEILFEQRNYQASANACRSALRGDGDPSWTKVWSYIQLGKIFDVTEQRSRALVQYELAVQTGDNNRGAVDEARKLLQEPFIQPQKH